MLYLYVFVLIWPLRLLILLLFLGHFVSFSLLCSHSIDFSVRNVNSPFKQTLWGHLLSWAPVPVPTGPIKKLIHASTIDTGKRGDLMQRPVQH